MQKEDIWKCTGVSGYSYYRISDIDDNSARSYCRVARERAARIASAWNESIATEWAMRNYLAVKMIFASQLLLNVASYSKRKGILLTHPYLIYYSLLSACRAFLFTDLTLEWRDGSICTASHKSIRNTTTNALRSLSITIADEIAVMIGKAKSQRELFSYNFPASGPATIPEGFIEICDVCPVIRLLCDLAEVNSECLETAWGRHSGAVFEIDWMQLSELGLYDTGGDDDDFYRLSYLSSTTAQQIDLGECG